MSTASRRPATVRHLVALVIAIFGCVLLLCSLALAAGGGGGKVGMDLAPLSSLPIPQPNPSDIINGSKATLGDVVDFYSRGGDFAIPEKSKRMQPINFGATDRVALVDFLTNADCRVEMERGPFDHPSLPLPNGANLAATGAAGRGTCP